jgi:hypothetical protein
VSATTGNDTTGTGTSSAPYKTMAKAITQAIGGKKRVYACIGTYPEQLQLTGADDGLTVYGGLDCANGWKYVGSAGTPTLVAPASATAAPGTALTVTGPMMGTTGIVFQDVSFASPDETGAGESSVAVFATGGAKLTLTRVNVTAGKAGDGAPGGTNANWSGAAPGGSSPSSSTEGGAGGANAGCVDHSSSNGGAGGSLKDVSGQLIWQPGGDGSSQPAVPSAFKNGGLGGNGCTAGTVGEDGPIQTTVGGGSVSSGSVTSAGWLAVSGGTAGAIGLVGQGGGGGGGSAASGAGPGSGGGSGGCGGGPGLGGTNGGSSIGILVFQSALALNSTVVSTGAGGAGGNGGSGQSGQAGGSPAPAATPNACAGGPGGNGSNGSEGGGGAGGHSIGIAWLGSTGPSVGGTVITQDLATYAGIATAAAGTGGSGGRPAAVGGSNNAVKQFH